MSDQVRSYNGLAALIQAENGRGVKSPSNLGNKMFELSQIENLPKLSDRMSERRDKLIAQIQAIVEEMQTRDVKLARIVLTLDNSDAMTAKVLRYKVGQFEIERITADFQRRIADAQSKLRKIETSIPQSQQPQFRLAVASARNATESDFQAANVEIESEA